MNRASVLALGAEMKSSLCRYENGVATMECVGGGDLKKADNASHFRALVEQLVTKQSWDALAIDMHPDYLSSQLGVDLSQRLNIPIIKVQHHHAHIASVLADHRIDHLEKACLGIALDGIGYGSDGTLWGGEFLRVDSRGIQRVGYLQPLPMIGGAIAAIEPWRNMLACLIDAGWNANRDGLAREFHRVDAIRFLQKKPLPLFYTMCVQNINSPKASSMGRIFDAVAATVGLCRDGVKFEAEAAIALEEAAECSLHDATAPYLFDYIREDGAYQLSFRSMWREILADLALGVTISEVAARFHQTVIVAIVTMAKACCRDHDLDQIVLSGGVFQNQLVRKGVEKTLQLDGFEVLLPQHIPIHDGGIALGQAWVAKHAL